MKMPRVRFTVRRMMVAVAVMALLLSAWQYRLENASIDRSLMAIQLRAFAGGDAAQRRMALEDLAHSGPDDRVLPALAAGLADGDWQVRLAAASSLGAVGRGWVWSGAADEKIDRAMRALISAFDDARAEVRIEAMRSLEAIYAPARPRWNPGLRAAGATFEATERRAVALLLRQMSDSDPAIRTAAVRAFSRVGPAAGAAPDPVVRIMLSDPEREVRTAAAGALPTGWPTLPELYVPLLHRLKQARSLEERSLIGWAFSGLSAPPIESIPDLLEALSLGNWVLNKTVPTALAKLGPAARPALPALAKVAAGELADPRTSALEAAQAIVTIDRDSPEAQALLEPIVALFRDSREGGVRQQAEAAIAKYGPSAAPAVQSLRMALGSDDADVRRRAAFLLGTIGPAAWPALEELTVMARQELDPHIRQVAAIAIRRIDVKSALSL